MHTPREDAHVERTNAAIRRQSGNSANRGQNPYTGQIFISPVQMTTPRQGNPFQQLPGTPDPNKSRRSKRDLDTPVPDATTQQMPATKQRKPRKKTNDRAKSNKKTKAGRKQSNQPPTATLQRKRPPAASPPPGKQCHQVCQCHHVC